MPYAQFGEQTLIDKRATKTFKLTAEGQKVTFRILGNGFYNAKHFLLKEDGNWNIFYCPRLMLGDDCEYCEQYFNKNKDLKELKEGGSKDKNAIKALEKEVRRFKPSIRWYYPILNRDTGKSTILETSLSVRNKLEDFTRAEVDILASDFVLVRTEKPGSDYYTLIRKDSKDTPKLSGEEAEEITKCLEWNIEEIVQGKESKLRFSPEEL